MHILPIVENYLSSCSEQILFLFLPHSNKKGLTLQTSKEATDEQNREVKRLLEADQQ